MTVDEEAPSKPTEHVPPVKTKNRRIWIAELVLLLFLIAAAVSLGVTLTRGNKNKNPAVSSESSQTDAQSSPNQSATIAVDMTKTEWPEVVGMPVRQAVEIIKAQRPDLTIRVLDADDKVSVEHDMTRVLVYIVEGNATVERIPRVG
jgi:Potato inhibitor I family